MESPITESNVHLIDSGPTSGPAETTARAPHTDPRSVGLVMGGGLLGAAARQALEQAWPSPSHGFPVATFLINLVGAFALGALLEGLARSGRGHDRRRRARLVLGTGFCGAFTTYSTFAVESVQLARHAAWITGVAYVVASVLGGLLVAAAGIRMAAGWAGRPDAGLPVDPDVDEEPEDP